MKGSRWKWVGGKLKAHILEEDVVEEITTRLWLEYGIRVWRVRERIPGQGRLSEAGIPDLIGYVRGYFSYPGFIQAHPTPVGRALFIECKRPKGGVHRLAQQVFISLAKQSGCIAFFACRWDDVAAELRQLGIEPKRRVA